MKRLLLVFLPLLAGGMMLAQNYPVSGTVVDDKGIPVIGASISVKEAPSVGTASGADGTFHLSPPKEATTLVVKAVGYGDLEVAISQNMRVVLSSTTLKEVVVTALGIERDQKSLGYVATTVGSEDLTVTGSRSALNALQGKVAGVEITGASGAPGASTRVVMRGYKTMQGSEQPLYVVDGVPVNNGVVSSSSLNGGMDFGNRVNDINPNDIESVTLLKGGSATALYGQRAASGVIMITTKSGAKSQGKAKVEVTSATLFETPLKLPTFQNEFGQGWYNRYSGYSDYDNGDLMENGSWGPRFDGVTRPWGFIVDNQQQIKPYVAMPNNVRDFFDTGYTLNNNVSVMNGDDNRSYYVSFGNVTSNGIMPTDVDSYNRNSVAMRGQAKFLKLFTVSGALNYVRKDMKYTPTGQDQAVLDAVWQTPRDINIVDLQDYNNKFNNVDNYYTVYSQNPYYVANEHGTKFGEDRIFGNLALNADILPWLKASFKVGTDVSNSTYKGWRAVTYCARATYNDTEGEVSEGAYRAAELNTDLILTAAQKFGDFAIDGLLGHNFNQQQSRSQLTSVVGLDVPFFYNISNSASTPSISEGISERRLVGIYANLNAGWKDMLYLNMTARNDWSSTLPVQNRSFFYPSASLSFIFSELMPKNKVLSFGKVRAGLSQTGKDASPYQVYSTYPQMSLTDGYRSQTFPLTSGSSSINGFTVSNQIGNSKLQPEISTELEIGFDVRFLDNRIGLDFAYYDATTTDLIFPVQITPSSGYTTQVMNLGKLSNKGFEIAANFVPVKTKDFVWDFSINFSKNDNKLVELNDLLTQVTIGGTSSISYVARPGEPFLFSALQHPKNFR